MTLALLTVALPSCGGDRTPRKVRPHAPSSPPPNGITSAAFRQCSGQLASQARFEIVPDRDYGGACTAYGAVRLLDIGVPVGGIGPMTCGLAANFTAWVRYGVAPAARVYLGSDLVRVESFGTFACRNIAGSAKVSEHARSNAVDVAAFVLADGRRISVKAGWNGGSEAERGFLRRVRESACKRFRTVLSPDYNADHHDHFHFDMGGKGSYCR